MSKNEPQSYGSQKEWVTGDTGEKVNDPKAAPSPKHEAFYDDRRDAESSGDHQGGHVSPVQLEESASPVAAPADEATATLPGVMSGAGGARRGGFFKNRDYRK